MLASVRRLDEATSLIEILDTLALSQGKLSRPLSDFVRGAKLLDEDNNASAALPLLSAGALASTPLADYTRYYTSRALL